MTLKSYKICLDLLQISYKYRKKDSDYRQAT